MASDLDHRQSVGQGVRELRVTRGLTQRDLADLLTVSAATVSAIESGNTGLSTARAVRIAEILDVPVQRFFVSAARAQPPSSRLTLPAVESVRTDWRGFLPLQLDAALTGALSSFLEFGYHGATMRTIAARATLSVPGLYHYYPGKQQMLVALLDLTMADLRARTESARAEGADPVQRFTFIVQCLALYHTHRRELAFVGATEMRSLARADRERVATMRRDEQRMVDVEVQHAVATGAFGTRQPKEAARAVVTMCTALAQWFRRDGPATAEQIADQYVGFALALVESK